MFCLFFYLISLLHYIFFFFFFQAEDGIRDYKVTGVQTCSLPISLSRRIRRSLPISRCCASRKRRHTSRTSRIHHILGFLFAAVEWIANVEWRKIGRASCRERV